MEHSQDTLDLHTIDGCGDHLPGQHLDDAGLCTCTCPTCQADDEIVSTPGHLLTHRWPGLCTCTRGCTCDDHQPGAEDRHREDVASARERLRRSAAYTAALAPRSYAEIYAATAR